LVEGAAGVSISIAWHGRAHFFHNPRFNEMFSTEEEVRHRYDTGYCPYLAWSR